MRNFPLPKKQVQSFMVLLVAFIIAYFVWVLINALFFQEVSVNSLQVNEAELNAIVKKKNL